MRHPLLNHKFHLRKDNLLHYLNTTDYFGFPANAVITENNKLVMGAGAALAFKLQFPDLDTILGCEIQQHINHHHYYVIFTKYLNYNLFAFQTKTHHQNKSSISLITNSLKHLAFFALQHKEISFHMPTPGIGCGGLSREEVYPLINEILPSNIILYEL